MRSAELKRHLLRRGATLVGVGDVTAALPDDIGHLKRAVSIAVSRGLNMETVKILTALQKDAEEWLRGKGYRVFSIPPDSDRKSGKFIYRLYGLFSHKTAATCSGLGWVGKNGLIINKEYGPGLSWATVLTDAPLKPDIPIETSLCGTCELCAKHCPSGAITGREWNLSEPFAELVRYEKCRSLKKNRHVFEEKPNCGLCINICPYSRQKKSLALKES